MQNQTPSTQTVLAIDTAGPRLQLALAVGGKVDVLIEELPKGHAEILFDRIQTLLSRNETTYSSLTRLTVTTGPGSFTGLRIGLSAARGLGLALGIPVIGVPTLLAMSLGASNDEPFTIAVDARRGEAYTQKFNAASQPVTEVLLVQIESVTADGTEVFDAVRADIAAMANFAATAASVDYPPVPVYVRAADAKPQEGFAVAHAPEAAS